MNNSNKKRLMIQPDAGLGNRLYCLYSAFYYKNITNREFDILWTRETSCNVGFDELFDISNHRDGLKVKSLYHLGYKNKHGLKMVLGDIYMFFLKKKYDYYSSEDTRDLYEAGGEDAILKLFMQDKRSCIKSFGPFFKLDKFSLVRHEIMPAKSILERVDRNMGSKEKQCNVVGVHIRRTDHERAIENSPTEAFTKLMDRELNQDPTTKFYLATDDISVEEELSKKYDFVNKDNFGLDKSRINEDAIKDAYVDMLCLSRCKKIFGSFESTFSEMASFIGDTELEVAIKNKNEK